MENALIVNEGNYQDYLDYEEFTVLQGNILKKTDSYNLSHEELKINCDWEVSHIYNRKRGMILYGFNKLVRELLSTRVTVEMVHSLKAHSIRNGVPLCDKIYTLWLHIANELDGRIPIKIEALPDGTWCPKGTPFAQVRNTMEGFGELVTWFEGVFLKMAFPSGCATRAFHMRQYLNKKRAEQFTDLGDATSLFMWRFHSFGYRGHNSEEGAFWGGTAWNLYLHGTDDFHASWYCEGNMMGSIRATAHKVTQQFNGLTKEQAYIQYGIMKRFKGDVVAMYHAIDKAATDPNPVRRVVALVIDTYHAYEVINNHIIDLANYAKNKGVHIVFRPDSGDVLEQGIMIYWKLKDAGLDGVGHIIIGEGMSFEKAQEYDERLERVGIPLMAFFYGIGAGFYKDIDRDWVGAALKTAYSNGADRMKLVLTAPEKSSIPGAVQLVNIDGILTIVPEEVAVAQGMKSEYRTLYNSDANQVILYTQSWQQIYSIANAQTGEQGDIAISPEILDKIEQFKQMLDQEDAV